MKLTFLEEDRLLTCFYSFDIFIFGFLDDISLLLLLLTSIHQGLFFANELL